MTATALPVPYQARQPRTGVDSITDAGRPSKRLILSPLVQQSAKCGQNGRLGFWDRRQCFVTFPTAAQGLVEYDELDGGRLLGDDDLFLDLVLLTLGVQNVQKIGG